MRKIIVGVAIALTLGTTMLVPTEADARGWRGGGYGWRGAAWRGGGWGGGRVVVVRPYRAFAAAPIMVAPVAVSCWRLVPGRWGWVQVWVC